MKERGLRVKEGEGGQGGQFRCGGHPELDLHESVPGSPSFSVDAAAEKD